MLQRGLLSFTPTDIILTHGRKTRKTQLRFMFLNLSYEFQNDVHWSETQQSMPQHALLLYHSLCGIAINQSQFYF